MILAGAFLLLVGFVLGVWAGGTAARRDFEQAAGEYRQLRQAREAALARSIPSATRLARQPAVIATLEARS